MQVARQKRPHKGVLYLKWNHYGDQLDILVLLGTTSSDCVRTIDTRLMRTQSVPESIWMAVEPWLSGLEKISHCPVQEFITKGVRINRGFEASFFKTEEKSAWFWEWKKVSRNESFLAKSKGIGSIHASSCERQILRKIMACQKKDRYIRINFRMWYRIQN